MLEGLFVKLYHFKFLLTNPALFIYQFEYGSDLLLAHNKDLSQRSDDNAVFCHRVC